MHIIFLFGETITSKVLVISEDDLGILEFLRMHAFSFPYKDK